MHNATSYDNDDDDDDDDATDAGDGVLSRLKRCHAHSFVRVSGTE